MQNEIQPIHGGDVIFFDWDGTIADSMDLCIEEIRLAMRRMGLADVPEATLRLCNGPTDEESIAILGIDPARGAEYLRLREEAEYEILADTTRLFPGIKEALARCGGGARLAVVSNGLQEYIRRSLSLLGLEGVFERWEGWRMGRTKAQALAELLAEMKPDRAIFVGDRIGDFNAAHACNVPALAAKFGYGNPAEWAQAEAVCETVEGLPAAARALLETPAARMGGRG